MVIYSEQYLLGNPKIDWHRYNSLQTPVSDVTIKQLESEYWHPNTHYSYSENGYREHYINNRRHCCLCCSLNTRTLNISLLKWFKCIGHKQIFVLEFLWLQKSNCITQVWFTSREIVCWKLFHYKSIFIYINCLEVSSKH